MAIKKPISRVSALDTARAQLNQVPPEYRKHLSLCIEDYIRGDALALSKYKHIPVDLKTFVEDEYYLNSTVPDGKGGKRPILYPVIMEKLIEINEGDYDEVVCTGSIGSGKSTIALYTQAYQLYLLSCMADPQGYFGLDPASEIVIVFQSLSKSNAQEIDYERFKAMIERCQYFQEKFPHNKYIENQLEFPNRIVVKPIAGTETGAISANVLGGMIDEINFMVTVENSKLADGGTYDQATALYNSIARRRASRFMSNGRMPGRLCLVSSRRTPGQFTDKKEEEAKTNTRIYVYDKRVWDVKPWAFTGRTFKLFIGDGSRQPKILEEDEVIPEADKKLVDNIPVEFKQAFIDDITKALRDIAGRSTLAIHPFMPRREDVSACFGRRNSVFKQDRVDFVRNKLTIRNALARINPDFPRWVHIDLGVKSDSAGIAIGHVPRFVAVKHGSMLEYMPVVEIDGTLEVPPPPNKSGEVDFSRIRKIIFTLRELGMPIKWVSLDSFQSTDTMQILRRMGFVVGYQSIDTTTIPYDLTKQALYERRVVAPTHEKLVKELTSLERDFRKGKIDHPVHGSKDVADALAGVVFGLTMRREVWAQHRVPIQQTLGIAAMMHDAETANKRGVENAAA